MADHRLKITKFSISQEQMIKKRHFVKSPFRYPGGKFYALKLILPFIECVPHDEFREPFVGGGNIFFAKEKSRFNWLNDLEEDIMNIYQVVSTEEKRKQLIKLLHSETANRDRHAQIRDLNVNGRIEKAFKTYYLNRTSYAGIIKKPAWGYEDGKSAPPQNWGALLEKAGEKLVDVKLTHLDFEPVIEAPSRGRTVLMYLDPPYYHADQKRAYTKPFELEDHLRLASLLRKTKYLFCLSYDNCEEIRKLYSWANISEKTWLYNTANKKNEARKLGRELLITNYRVELSQMSLFG